MEKEEKERGIVEEPEVKGEMISYESDGCGTLETPCPNGVQSHYVPNKVAMVGSLSCRLWCPFFNGDSGEIIDGKIYCTHNMK